MSERSSGRADTRGAAPRAAPPLRAAAVAGLSLAFAACGVRDARPIELQVYAASSLTEAFRELEAAYERSVPDVDVAITFAGSQVLRLQIEKGARADVFASANPEHMATLVEAGLVEEGLVFATNQLVVIVPPDNPAGIETFGNLTRARRLVIGTPNVPVGIYAREALRRADATYGAGFADSVLARVVSEESNVRLARAKVALGEADAAIVYRTDALASDAVRALAIPDEIDERAEYRIGIVAGTARRDAAEAWLAFALGEGGRDALRGFGFGVPGRTP
jgi:molybdate transport system substrate-binding protein